MVDIDLHVTEPSNKRVTSINRVGDVGYIDNDSYTAGKETYTTCTPGSYLIGVNYYADNDNVGPTEVTIRINGGSNITLPLIHPVGEAGENYTPYIFGNLIWDETGVSIVRYPTCNDSFEVYLFWDQETTDINLHVMEPNGAHVKFNNPVGPVGELVRANNFAEFGPEVYKTTCGQLQSGNYDLRMNLYDGLYITNSVALIRVGNDWYVSKRTHTQKFYDFGETNTPFSIGIVHISLDSEGVPIIEVGEGQDSNDTQVPPNGTISDPESTETEPETPGNGTEPETEGNGTTPPENETESETEPVTEQPVQGIECPAGTERLSARLNW